MITYITALITWRVGYLGQRVGEAANPGPGASSHTAIENEDEVFEDDPFRAPLEVFPFPVPASVVDDSPTPPGRIQAIDTTPVFDTLPPSSHGSTQFAPTARSSNDDERIFSTLPPA